MQTVARSLVWRPFGVGANMNFDLFGIFYFRLNHSLMIIYVATRDELWFVAEYLASWGRGLLSSIRLMSYDQLH